MKHCKWIKIYKQNESLIFVSSFSSSFCVIVSYYEYYSNEKLDDKFLFHLEKFIQPKTCDTIINNYYNYKQNKPQSSQK